MRFALLMLTACGSPPEPLPPTVGSACARVIECGVCEEWQASACISCIEHWAEQINQALIDHMPPLETIACNIISDVLTSKKVVRCIDEEWFK